MPSAWGFHVNSLPITHFEERAGTFLWFSAGTLGKCQLFRKPASTSNVQRSWGIHVLTQATLVRAIFLSIAIFGTLAPYRSLAEDGNQLSIKANKELPPQLLSLLLQRNMPKRSPILIRIFKEESSLKSGSRIPPAGSSFSRSSRSAAGPAISARRSAKATVRHRKASTRSRPA